MAKEHPNQELQQSGQANRPISQPAHALPHVVVTKELETNADDGLTGQEAKSRLDEYGRNELDDGPRLSPVKILVRQVANAMILVMSPFFYYYQAIPTNSYQVLIMAMAVSFGISSYIEGGVIAAVIILNVVVGFYQEFNAEKTMDSLRSLSSPTAVAVRDGSTITVPTAEIVPGDIVELKTGDVVPADIR